MSNEKNKTVAKKASGKGSSKPNATAGRTKKINTAGKGARSQSNKTKVAGVPKEAAKKLPRKASKKQTT